MYVNLKETAKKILLEAKDEIASNMAVKNINASGRTSASLRVVEEGSHIMLKIGGDKTAPIETLEIGRPGGKVPYNFKEIIYLWSIDKKINFSSVTDRKKFAYLSAKKIEREGTERHRKPRNDVYSNVVKKTVEKLNKEIKNVVISAIKTN